MNLRDLLSKQNFNLIKESAAEDIINDMFLSKDKKIFNIDYITALYSKEAFTYSLSEMIDAFENVLKNKTFNNDIKSLAREYNDFYAITSSALKDMYKAMDWVDTDSKRNVKSMSLVKLIITFAIVLKRFENKKNEVTCRKSIECISVLKSKYNIKFPKIEKDLKI